MLREISDKRVLIVDPDEDFCILMKAYLLRKGCSVYIFYNLVSARFNIDEIKPEVVVLDKDIVGNMAPLKKQIRSHVPDARIFLGGYEVY